MLSGQRRAALSAKSGIGRICPATARTYDIVHRKSPQKLRENQDRPKTIHLPAARHRRRKWSCRRETFAITLHGSIDESAKNCAIPGSLRIRRCAGQDFDEYSYATVSPKHEAAGTPVAPFVFPISRRKGLRLSGIFHIRGGGSGVLLWRVGFGCSAGPSMAGGAGPHLLK